MNPGPQFKPKDKMWSDNLAGHVHWKYSVASQEGSLPILNLMCFWALSIGTHALLGTLVWICALFFSIFRLTCRKKKARNKEQFFYTSTENHSLACEVSENILCWNMDMCQLRHGFKKQLLQQQSASCTLFSFLHKLILQNQKQRLFGANTNKTCLPSTVWLIYSQVVIARRFYCTAWLVLCHKRLLSSSKAKKENAAPPSWPHILRARSRLPGPASAQQCQPQCSDSSGCQRGPQHPPHPQAWWSPRGCGVSGAPSGWSPAWSPGPGRLASPRCRRTLGVPRSERLASLKTVWSERLSCRLLSADAVVAAQPPGPAAGSWVLRCGRSAATTAGPSVGWRGRRRRNPRPPAPPQCSLRSCAQGQWWPWGWASHRWTGGWSPFSGAAAWGCWSFGGQVLPGRPFCGPNPPRLRHCQLFAEKQTDPPGPLPWWPSLAPGCQSDLGEPLPSCWGGNCALRSWLGCRVYRTQACRGLPADVGARGWGLGPAYWWACWTVRSSGWRAGGWGASGGRAHVWHWGGPGNPGPACSLLPSCRSGLTRAKTCCPALRRWVALVEMCWRRGGQQEHECGVDCPGGSGFHEGGYAGQWLGHAAVEAGGAAAGKGRHRGREREQAASSAPLASCSTQHETGGDAGCTWGACAGRCRGNGQACVGSGTWAGDCGGGASGGKSAGCATRPASAHPRHDELLLLPPLLLGGVGWVEADLGGDWTSCRHRLESSWAGSPCRVSTWACCSRASSEGRASEKTHTPKQTHPSGLACRC